ncbi:hypothetical protein FNF31_00827 [Cafeteria roenbergensis]|uniref:ATP-dependent DNA helicase n=1 Tax=Cafeteria roenbergensis TaxID=33653 RepID=A0A5A8D3Y2_CAFRO|nr:hypothetical protein FNF28_06148 [Cafeteria roenbergensis]KAA0167386.1 hypothetical protein FNF31_00827 [Cafeteria roenbergensis]
MPRDEIEDAILAFVKKRAASPADIARCLVGSISARAFQDTGTFGALRRRNVSRDHVVNVIQRMIRQQRGITIDRHLGGRLAAAASGSEPSVAQHGSADCSAGRDDELHLGVTAAAPSRAAAADDDDTSSAELSPGQARVLAAVSAGRSIFFTGPAGTGKSFLLRRAIESLRERHGAGAVFVTAATGIAACHIGGTTLHSFAGVGIAKHGAEAAAAAAVRSGNAVQRWRACRCLVVDEVSMVDAQLFEAVELTARRARRSNAPFGGVQLVLTGDFLQLPPVGLDEDDSAGGFGTRRGGRPAPASAGAGAGAGRGRGRGGKQAAPAPPAVKYCFESPRWAACVSESAMLQTVFRQRDQRFVDLLNSLRAGRAGDAERRLLASAGAEVAAAEARGEDPTRLFARNRDVDALNARKLASLPGEAVELEAVDGGEHPWLGTLQRNCAAPTSLRLKLGARVMLLKNVDVEAGLVNGATGRIVDFVRQPGAGEGAPADLPRVEFALRNSDGETHTVTRTVERSSWSSELGGVPVAWREQVPLKLAWALSIHKAQGMTLPLVDVSSPAARRAAPGGAAASDAGGSAIDREVAALLAGLDANDLE